MNMIVQELLATPKDIILIATKLACDLINHL